MANVDDGLRTLRPSLVRYFKENSKEVRCCDRLLSSADAIKAECGLVSLLRQLEEGVDSWTKRQSGNILHIAGMISQDRVNEGVEVRRDLLKERVS